MKQTSEAAFETSIEAVLLNDGYSKLSSGTFDTERAIFPDEALTFIRETQAKTWEKLEALHGAETGERDDRSRALKWPNTHGCTDHPAPRLQVLRQDLPHRLISPLQAA